MKNIYQEFIEYCKTIENELILSKEYKECHHIIPKHSGGIDNKENLIFLSKKNHILAHFYRYLSYDENGDKIAYYFMINDPTGEAKRLAGKMGQKNRTFQQRSDAAKKAMITQKKKGTGLFNRGNNWKRNVSKIAKKNILVNRKKRMNKKTILLMQNKYILSFNGIEFGINMNDFDNFAELFDYLKEIFKFKHNKDSKRRIKFINLFTGINKNLFNFSIVKVISSQAIEG